MLPIGMSEGEAIELLRLVEKLRVEVVDSSTLDGVLADANADVDGGGCPKVSVRMEV